MSGELAIQVQDIHKDFGEVYAVKGIDFEVQRGEIFSLIGPNGAGKSTTISMISGLLLPDQGEISVAGYDIRKKSMQAKKAVGVVPQDIALYEDLSARENLTFWGKMYGLRGTALKNRVIEILDIVGLNERQNGRVGKFSGGMKRRLNIGIALLHNPEILIMDEPTVGIDPQSRRNILENVKGLNQQGMTVLYTTHNMEEAQELSDHIAIMDFGKIIASGTHNALVKIIGGLDRIAVTINSQSSKVTESWQSLEGVHNVMAENGYIQLLVEDSNFVLPQLFEFASHCHTRITSVEIQEPNLEAVFLHLTGRALRD